MKKSMIVILFAITLLLATTQIYAAENNSDTDITNTNSTITQTTAETPTTSTNVYVNQSKTSLKEDGTQTNPFKTIDETKLNNIKNNSVVNIANGKYNVNTINLNNNLTIIGENRNNTIIYTNQKTGLLNINEHSSLKLINLTIRDYNSTEYVAIDNKGTLIIENSFFQNGFRDSQTAKGGFIYNTNNLIVNNSEFDNDTASWGGSIYNEGAKALIINSTFTNSEPLNVGGAIYSINSDMSVYDCTFIGNRAVSGAAIYNAFGNMTVNNTTFYKNDAQAFFGGAIYNTGITTVTNSNFISNHANYDGGAITNTHIFNSINNSYEYNLAEAEGGAIQNIAMSENELGQVNLINSSFIENSATSHGGAISNKYMTDLTVCGIITSRNTLFYKNSAGKNGGAINNLKYLDAQYTVFIDNTDDENHTIVSDNSTISHIISLDNNWWGVSNPRWKDIGYTPDTWIVANYTNTTPFIKGLETKVIVNLDKTNTNKTINETIPLRLLVYYGENTSYLDNNQDINKTATNTVVVYGNESIAQIDNEVMRLIPLDSNITYELINDNQTIKINANLPDQINGKINLKINGVSIETGNIVNGKYTTTYDIPTGWSKDTYTLNTIIQTKTGEVLRDNLTIEIPKRDVITSITINNQTNIEAGSTIDIIATVKIGDNPVNHGYVTFKLSGQTFASKIKVVNGTVKISYTLPITIKVKEYTIDIVYSGDLNKNSNRNSTKLVVDKHLVHVDIDQLDLFQDSTVDLRIEFLDSNNHTIPYGQACYKINGKTIETNINLDNGVIFISFKTPRVENNNSLKQTMTLKLGENNNHYSFAKDIIMIIE